LALVQGASRRFCRTVTRRQFNRTISCKGRNPYHRPMSGLAWPGTGLISTTKIRADFPSPNSFNYQRLQTTRSLSGLARSLAAARTAFPRFISKPGPLRAHWTFDTDQARAKAEVGTEQRHVVGTSHNRVKHAGPLATSGTIRYGHGRTQRSGSPPGGGRLVALW